MALESFIRLKELSTGYTVFEPDQVLTDEHLNRLADHLDDAQRLTRVTLLGVGIFGGLRVSVGDAGIRLTPGVGVTTDGDLLRVTSELTYTRFRKYDETAPIYPPFFDGATMRPVFELLAEGVAGADPLARFAAVAGTEMSEMTALLLMESYVKDGDLCTGGDCDNKGRDAISNVRLLLVRRSDVKSLVSSIEAAGGAATKLAFVTADRAILTEGLTTPAVMLDTYTKACRNIRQQLTQAFATLAPSTGTVFTDVLGGDPAGRWTAGLKISDKAAEIQRCYGFFKDVVDTWNELREALYADISVVCPPLTAFPKHLLLGDMPKTGPAADANRTGTFPSPLNAAGRDALEHAKFLARKIDTLIRSFTLTDDIPNAPAITPSYSEDRPLEQRAIPSYYAANAVPSWPIHRAWNFTLERRGLARANYGARASEYNGNNGAEQPLAAQIARFDLFRVEGHVGKPVAQILTALKTAIATRNIPFLVRHVLVGAEREKLKVKPDIRYSDLHRFHYLIRQDLVKQLDEVADHHDSLRARIDQEVDTQRLPDNIGGIAVPSIKGFAATKQTAVAASVKAAKEGLNKTFAVARAGAWQPEVTKTMTEASDLKLKLGEVARGDIASPVDALVINDRFRWLPWLDQIIDTKEKREDDKLLFVNFIKEHPAAEHLGGVERGGTLVLLYDPDGNVIGDVALPYWWPEVAEAPAEEPPLPLPPIKPPILIKEPIRVIPPLDKFVRDKIRIDLDEFTVKQIEPLKQQAVELPKQYLQSFKDTATVFGGFTKSSLTNPILTNPGIIKDAVLGFKLKEVAAQSERVSELNATITDPQTAPEVRTRLTEELKIAETNLGTAINAATTHVATSEINPADGSAAMSTVSAGIERLSPNAALEVTKKMETTVTAGTAVPGLKPSSAEMIKNVTGRFRLR